MSSVDLKYHSQSEVDRQSSVKFTEYAGKHYTICTNFQIHRTGDIYVYRAYTYIECVHS